MLWTIGQKRKRVKNNYKLSGNFRRAFSIIIKLSKRKMEENKYDLQQRNSKRTQKLHK